MEGYAHISQSMASHMPPWRALCLLLLLLNASSFTTSTASAIHSFTLEATAENEATILRAVQLYNDAREAADRGDQQRAMHLYEDAIDGYALLATAYNNLGMLVYEMTHDTDLAFALLERGAAASMTLGDNATLAATRNNMGFLVRDQHEHSVEYCLRAIEFYDAALEVVPDFIDALYNKASALTAMRQFGDAIVLLQRVLELEPHHTSAHMDMGAIFFDRGDIERAVYHEDAIIAMAPMGRDKLGAMHNKGHFLKAGDRLVEAWKAHEDALALAPDHPIALADVVIARRTLCLWTEREELLERLLDAVDKQLHENSNKSTALLPYDSTLIDISDRIRMRLAIAHSRSYEQSATLQLLPLHPATTTDDASVTRPLRIGYATYDFRDHPMGHLTLGLLDAHDSARVAVYCYSYGLNDRSEWRQRAEQRCDVFRDGRALSDLDFARQIAVDEVDILVDLMAHTTGARLGLSSLRPSRIVVNYLGYPGTMGSSFTDYVIADRFVVPPEVAAATMTEQVVYLPHAYQVNEYNLEIPACGAGDLDCMQTIRKEQGLPVEAIVFCNFNTIDKMEPVSFGVWMNILRRVPTSVLWLLQPSRKYRERIEATLRDEAQAHSVDPARIMFASRVPKRQHLARISAADIFLDSFVYNAHSTAADALWTNVPLVSVWGDSFPSRVAASLIQNVVRLPELVPHSIKEYEDLAVQLAEHPDVLTRWRFELARHALAAPLFDTLRITGYIEDAYEAMHDIRHRLEVTPSAVSSRRFHIMVEPSATQEFTTPEQLNRRIRDAITKGIASQGRGEFTHAKCVYERVLRAVPHHSDAMHLLGLTLYQMGKLELALDQLTRVVNMYDTIPLFVYNRAVVLEKLGRHYDAKEDFRAALILDPSYVDAFFKLTDKLHDSHEFDKMIAVYEQFGARILSGDGTPASERERGYLQLSFALTKTGRVQDAIETLNIAMKAYPTFFRLARNLAAIYSNKGDHRAGDELQIRTVETEALHVYAERGRHFEKYERSAGQQVVVFYCHEYGQSWWPSWGPSSLNVGLGGSEEAVVFMARELHRLGYWVEVYGDPPPEDITDASAAHRHGVYWYPHYTYDPDDRGVDIFIAWRYHISLVVGRHSRRRIFWVHDVPSDDAKQSRLLEELADGIFCVSKFQASLFPQRHRSKLFVISNALDPMHFIDDGTTKSVSRNHRFVYGSSPSRGLFELLQVWPQFRARVPEATLRIFYGFTPAFVSWGKSNIPNFDAWKRAMDEMLQQPGVEYIGLVDHKTLAQEYASAGFYLYPTTFSETSCISLMKAMANGAIPITSRFPTSALSETVGDFDLGPEIFHDNPSVFETGQWLDVWIESALDAVEHEAEANNLRQRMVQFARRKYQWASIALEWQAFFNTHLV